MSIIHGSEGLIYFVHEWEPKFNEAALLSDPQMLAAVTALNGQIQKLAPVLNTPSLAEVVQVATGDSEVAVAAVAKRLGEALHIFAVGMRDGQTTATFTVKGATGQATVEVLHENRTLPLENGEFRDTFRPWDVHLYRITARLDR